MSSVYDPRITAYFGDAVMRAGFMPTPHLFLRHYAQLGLGHGEAMFVLQLMEINWDLAEPPKTVNEIAQRMGVNARTVRRYSEAVAAIGLITLYDQYDDSGAQIENGYDLSPLFERLATFAPEPPLGGQARRRERRSLPGTTGTPRHEGSDLSVRARRRSPGTAVTHPPDMGVTPPAGTPVMPLPDTAITARADESITGRRIDSSGLNRETRISQEQQNMLHDAAATPVSEMGSIPPCPAPGWSLRHGQPLSADDVARTDSILQRMGIDMPVRSRIRTSLAPADAWTLWTYALAKRWSVPLLITAVYDKASRQARPADIPQHYDAVGTALAQLDPETAEQLLVLVADHRPDASLVPSVACLGADPRPDVVAALDAVRWMIAEVRAASGTPGPRVPAAPGHAVPLPVHAMTWIAVLDRLATRIAPSEFTTWLQETTLLELEPTCAFVGASNVFARERIESAYLETIQQTLSEVLGRTVEVQVVITMPGDAPSRASAARPWAR